MIRFSIEHLYHFNCPECQKWWSIGDFHLVEEGKLTCPHCQHTAPLEEIKNA